MRKWIVAAARMSAPFYAGAQSGAIDATTATGERVRLLPMAAGNGSTAKKLPHKISSVKSR